jgi:hypothetical protein
MDLIAGCARIKLNKGVLNETLEWANELNHRISEVKESMEGEGVYIESVFLDNINGDDYLIYYMRMVDPERAREAFKKSAHKIDQYHSEFKMKCWENVTPLKLILDVSRSV